MLIWPNWESIEPVDGFLSWFVRVMGSIVEVKYFMDVFVVLYPGHLHQRVMHEQVRCPLIIFPILVFEIIFVDLIIQLFSECARGWGEILSGQSICAWLKDLRWHLNGDPLGWLSENRRPVDVTGVHHPNRRICRVNRIYYTQALPSYDFIVQIQLHHDILGLTISRDGDVSALKSV